MLDTLAVVKELISSSFLLIFPLNIRLDLAKSTKTTLTISPRYFPAMYFSNLKQNKYKINKVKSIILLVCSVVSTLSDHTTANSQPSTGFINFKTSEVKNRGFLQVMESKITPSKFHKYLVLFCVTIHHFLECNQILFLCREFKHRVQSPQCNVT